MLVEKKRELCGGIVMGKPCGSRGRIFCGRKEEEQGKEKGEVSFGLRRLGNDWKRFVEVVTRRNWCHGM